AALERHMPAFDAARRLAQMEDDAMLLVDGLNESAELRPKDLFHGSILGRDDMDLEIAGAQRRRHFETDEARSQNQHAPRGPRAFDDRPAVRKRTKHEKVGRLRARDGWAYGLGPGREKQAIKGDLVAVRKRDFARPHVDGGGGRIEPKVDRVVGIEALV